MTCGRRDFLRVTCAAAGVSLAAPLPLLASTGPRVFDLFRGSSNIGQQTLDVSSAGDQINVAVDIRIKVSILGLPAYAYQLSSREVWAKGALQRLDAKCNDNGAAHRASVLRQGDTLRIDGSGYSGVLDGTPATTTYWSKAFLQRGTWISTQDGTPMQIRAARGGMVNVPTPTGATEATRYRVRGDIGRLDLFYDAGGEWIGNEFDARGQQARFVLTRRGRDLAGLIA